MIVELSGEDNGRKVMVRVGDRVVVRLNQPVVPQRWQLERYDRAVIEQVGEVELSPKMSETGQILIGSSIATFTLEAIGAGTTSVEFRWGPRDAPYSTFCFEGAVDCGSDLGDIVDEIRILS